MKAFPDSDRAAQAMRLPGCYPHPAVRIELIETHISRVFLTGEFAYKTKKPVDLGFLDFTTLESRRHYCGEEVRLNRRTADRIYLGVVPVSDRDGDIKVGEGGGGQIIDYAVKMRQFPQDALFDRMARRGALERWHLDPLAELLARFHATAERAGPQSPFGTAARVLTDLVRNLDGLHEAGERGLLDRLCRWTVDAHRLLEPAFGQRLASGQVRECHGDLHLRNVAWIDGRPVPFDCIEFNEGLRWIDVMSEVGFLTMDLADHGLAWLGHRFLNRYLEITGDYGGLRVLTFYEVYRALVRAKVSRLRETQCDPGSPAASDASRECARRLELASVLSLDERPALILMNGLSGSGKTTVSQAVVERFGAVRLRSDVERKRLHGLDAHAATGSGVGAGLYAPDASEGTYGKLAELARLVLDAGRPVVVDATFIEHARRDAFRRIARAARVPFAIIRCEAHEDELRRRVRQRRLAGADASEAGIAVLEHQLAMQQPIAADEAGQTVVLRPYDSLDEGFPAGDRLAQLLRNGDEAAVHATY